MKTIGKFTGKPVTVGNSKGIVIPKRQVTKPIDTDKTYFVEIKEMEETDDES